MITKEALPFINDYIDSINKLLKYEHKQLSALQAGWLKFVIMGIIFTNTVCFARFSRYSLGAYAIGAISWMFRSSKIPWNRLLLVSARHVIRKYNIKSCSLVIDDSDRARSKNTSRIAKTHKMKDKLTAGYTNGQNIVFLVLVSKEITIPIGYELYEPDPKLKEYQKEDKRLRQKKVAKKYRPVAPERSHDHPTRVDLSVKMLKVFVKEFSEIKITSVSADMAYGTRKFIEQAASITQQKQILTQVKSNQNIVVHKNNKVMTIKQFFEHYSGTEQVITLRGNDKRIRYISCKLKVQSHGAIYRVIALKYDNEEEYRYIIANDASWQPITIIQAYALRWLVEVFIQDWKSYEGWDQLAKQPGIEGSVRGIVLSLLCDHALLTHQEQIALFKKREPACTVGSLRERVIMDSLLAFIQSIVCSDNPQALFNEHKSHITEVFQLRSSKKHMRHMYDDDNCIEDNLAAA